MKLTLKIKLYPTADQAKLLLQTMKQANAVCDGISAIAWKEKCFNKINLHHRCYYESRTSSDLSAQMTVRCIAKVADAYKADKEAKKKRKSGKGKTGKKELAQISFKPLGAIAYDARILSYLPGDCVSIWTMGGRIRIPYFCFNPEYFPYIQGEADLLFKKGKFYLCQTVEVPKPEKEEVEEFIGCDLGITNIAVTSDEIKHSGKWINEYRAK
ncbi:MAG: RNA-guided endonuclease InsQ/TnpB family protein, partial [Candidatus Saccharimonadales bacterium]